MTLADDLKALTVPVPPKQYQQHAEYDTETGKGVGATGPVRAKITDERQLLELAGFDADVFRIVGKISQWTKTFHGKEDTYSFFFQVETIRANEDNPAAAELAKLIRPIKPAKRGTTTGLPRVVCIADGQIGKDGPDGDHDTMESRYREALAHVAAIVKAQKPSVLVIADNGDPIEGITSSAPNQIATNTLEFPDQLRLWQRRLTQTILTLAPFAGKTIVAAVPSNHGEVRNSAGKVGWGDHGISIAKTVEEAFDLLAPSADIEFVYPETKYDVITYVDVEGTRVAFTHGHHAKGIDRMPQWIANQAAAQRSPMGETKIVCHGHFHQPGYTWSRGREIISCPMFDAGSPWFTNLTGEWSPAGIATFSIRDSRVHDLRFVEP